MAEEKKPTRKRKGAEQSGSKATGSSETPKKKVSKKKVVKKKISGAPSPTEKKTRSSADTGSERPKKKITKKKVRKKPATASDDTGTRKTSVKDHQDAARPQKRVTKKKVVKKPASKPADPKRQPPSPKKKASGSQSRKNPTKQADPDAKKTSKSAPSASDEFNWGRFGRTLAAVLATGTVVLGTIGALIHESGNEPAPDGEPDIVQRDPVSQSGGYQHNGPSGHQTPENTSPSEAFARTARGFPLVDNHTNIPNGIESALAKAAEHSGLRYDFMVRMAFKESSFRATIPAETSSACGLMQITGSTMREYVWKYAKECGYDDLLQHVERYNAGTKAKPDYKYRYNEDAQEEAKQALYQARLNPEISAMLAACHLRDAAHRMEQSLDRELSQTDLYAIHFMGFTGARKFLSANDDPAKSGQLVVSCDHVDLTRSNGSAKIKGFDSEASHVSKWAAQANGNIFFRENTEAGQSDHVRTVREVFQKLERVFPNMPVFQSDEVTGQQNTEGLMVSTLPRDTFQHT